MKALFVIDTLGAGGAERSLQEMLPLFERDGVEPVLACFHHRKEGVEHLVFGRQNVRVLGGSSKLAQVRALRRLIRSEGIELVHTSLFEADVLGRTATAGTGIPVVTSLVNMAYEPARLANDQNVDPARLLLVRLLEAGTGHLFADHFHAITHAVKDAAVTYFRFPPRKITVVYRGRDEVRLGRREPGRRQRVRASLGVDPDAFLVFTAGRQEFQKGQRFLIEAFGRVVETRPDAVLLIAGREGGATAVLQAAAASPAVRDRVRFLGHRDDVPDLMAASDVFVLPSLWEGLGGVLIEAMALELPIVASDIEAIREATDDGESALLVPPGDARGLATAILSIADDPDARERLRTRGQALYKSRYTLERSARGMVRIFERVLSDALPARSR